MVSIFVILIHFDGRRVPDWPYTINLSTLVSLMATLFRAALLAVVSEIISQMKWSWFQSRHRLIDMERFDQASRGVLGVLKFFGTVPKTTIGTSAAGVVLVSLAISPFSQQAIKSVICQEPNPSASASIPASNIASGGIFRYGAHLYRLEPNVQAAFINGLMNPLGKDSAIVTNCSTGNCTFPEYAGVTHSTIGLCSACIDLTDQITTIAGSQGNNYTLPGGLWVTPLEQGSVLSVGDNHLEWLSSQYFGNMSTAFRSSLNNVTILALTQADCSLSPKAHQCINNVNTVFFSGNMRPLAVSCAVYPCLKNFRGSVTVGQFTEELVSSIPATLEAEGLTNVNFHSHTALKMPCAVGGRLYDKTNFSLLPSPPFSFEPVLYILPSDPTARPEYITAPYECIYKFYWATAAAVADFHRNFLFSGRCTGNGAAPGVLHCPDTAFWLNSFWADGKANLTFVADTMDRFTAAVTNRIRTDGSSLYRAMGRDDARPDVMGLAKDTTLCVQFDWVWLALPVVLLIAGGLLLGAVIINGYFDKDQRVWKSSLLPLLFCGFVEHPRMPSSPNQDELEKMAKEMTVEFKNDHGVAGFVAARPNGAV